MFSDLSPMVNHLWQSTFCTAAVWVLTLVLKKNRAAVRYWLWLAASVKFLVPLSLLVTLGSQLGWRTIPGFARHRWSLVIDNIGRPFVVSAPAPRVVTPATSDLVPAILFGVWLSGFVISISSCFWQWRRIRAAQKRAAPLALGLPIPVMSSTAHLEPGVIGIIKPTLLLPEGITDRLTPSQLDAIVTHEMCHVRRWDNLTAAVHMVVEAVFWFYPPVWWIRQRLVEERELACDEEVLQSGSEPQVYAEGIINVCKFYVQSRVPCVSGISGSSLTKRIVGIMTQCSADELSLSRKMLLAAVGIAAVTGPVMFGLLTSPQIRAQSVQSTATTLPAFDVASVKRTRLAARTMSESESRANVTVTQGNLIMRNYNLRDCIEWAYQLKSYQISGPGWLNTEKYDISAKADRDASEDQMRLMFQRLLAERFHLLLHHEQKESPVYALLVGKNGPKLRESQADSSSVRLAPPGLRLVFQKETLSQLADTLSTLAFMDRPVVELTGRRGAYDFTLDLRDLMESETPRMGTTVDQGAGGELPVVMGPSIFTVIGEQLGLRLEPRKAPLDVLVVDSAMRTPTEN